MKQTNKYQFNLIETSDPFTPDSINQNTQAIENAMVAHAVDSDTHSDIRGAINDHAADKENPHGVTAAQVGAAASSHNHSAANITSGTLTVARGGTGNTSVDTAPTNGSTKMVTSGGVYTALAGKANIAHSHPANAITSGTLPVARGGTGYTSVDSAPTSGSKKMVTSDGVYTALGKKYGTDNAGWVTGTYVGTGVVETPQTITLGFQPSAVIITRVDADPSNTGFAICIRSGNSQGSLSSASKPLQHTFNFFNTYCNITDSGFSVLKGHSSYNYGLNEATVTYVYIAFK